MTLTELKYIVAVAREKHFGRAAESCYISQPTLSVSIKKLEEELDAKIFERSAGEIGLTPLGEEIVAQAQTVLEQAARIYEIAKSGKDPLAAPLRLGVIYTIGPYLLPELVRHNIERTPQMPLMLHENFTHRLLEMLRTGEIDCAILAEPFPDSGLASLVLYDEPFMVAVPSSHALAQAPSVSAEALKQEHMLLLGAGHCFRDHVLEVCPEAARLGAGYGHEASSMQKSFEGSSLETIKHMVAAGMGVTVVPVLSVPPEALALASGKRASKMSKMGKIDKAATKGSELFIQYLPFSAQAPTRRVVLVWRRSFTRYEAMAELRNAVYACALPGVLRPSV
jgi:LysR family hydrogen peroxide-inducible transcriptional activator